MAKGQRYPISEQKRNFLFEQIQIWKRQKIVTADQEKNILSLYEIKTEHKSISGYIAIFGAILIGLGIVLFFALNWQEIPKMVKVASIIGFMLAFYHLGYVLGFSKANLPKVGAALIFLGSILFGAAIFLIAQIYNINSHWPNGFLFWTLGLIPLTYLVLLPALAYLMILGAIVYVFSESLFWFQLIERYYHVPYAFMLIFLSLGVALYALGVIHEKKQSLQKLRYPFHLFGSFLVLAVLYLFSFKWFAREQAMVSETSVLFASRFWVMFLVISALAGIALFIAFQKRNKKDIVEFYELVIPLVMMVIIPLLVLFAQSNVLLMPLFFNILLFLSIVGVIYLGLSKKDQTLVNVGLLAFGISVFSRYVEYLWDVINGYLFFLIAGVLLIGLSIVLEKNRRKLMQGIKNE